MKAQNIKKIEEFLKSLKSEIDIPYMVTIEDIDLDSPFDSIRDMIEDGNGFDIEIIYYSKAIEYLQENDPSLRESFSIASELGYTLDNLNSETLASLLASQNSRNEFEELEKEIESFFAEIKEDEETEEDEEETQENN